MKSLLEYSEGTIQLNSSLDCNISHELNEKVKINVLEHMLSSTLRFAHFLMPAILLKNKNVIIQNKGVRKRIKNTKSKLLIDK